MGKSAILAIKIVSDVKDGTKGLDTATSKLDAFQQKVNKASIPAAAIVAGAGIAGKAVIGYASDAEQAVGGVETVFGKHAAEVTRQAGKADQALGLSEAAYNSLATNVGGSLKKAGFAQDELGGKTDDLISRAADLSSVFGGDTVSATGAMGAALRGEFDSLEQYGVFLNAAAVNSELARTGQDKLTGSALDAAKKQATYNLIMEQSADYAGNFAKEADTAAGAEQRAAAARENAAAAIGTMLLPAYTMLQNTLATVATFVTENSTAVGILAGIVTGLAATVLLVNGALRVYTAVTAAWTVVTKAAAVGQRILNAAMKANPIGLVITAATILIGLFVLLYNRSETFRNAVQAAGRLGQAALGWVLDKARALGSGISTVASGISSRWSSMVAGIRRIWDSAVNRIRSAWTSTVNAAKSAADRLGSGVTTVVNGIRSGFDRVMSVLRRVGSAFTSAGNIGRNAMNGIVSVVRNLIGWVNSALSKLKSVTNIGGGIKALGRGIGSLFGWQRVTPQAPPLDGSPFYLTAAEASRLIPSMPLAPAGGGRAGGRRTVVVNIYGAIDPNRTARHVREVLDNDSARDGGPRQWR